MNESHTPEPLQIDFLHGDTAARAAECVNACLGINKPDLAIPAARDNLRQLNNPLLTPEQREALIKDTLKTLGSP